MFACIGQPLETIEAGRHEDGDRHAMMRDLDGLAVANAADGRRQMVPELPYPNLVDLWPHATTTVADSPSCRVPRGPELFHIELDCCREVLGYRSNRAPALSGGPN